MEIWKDVKGYEDIYKVSNLGRVKRLIGYQAKKERILTQINNGSDYMGVSLCKNGKAKKLYTHRIVAESFINNPKSKDEVNHIDGNRQNNKLENLEWVTRSENHNHRYQVLKQKGVNFGKTGSKNWRSKPCLKFDLNGKLLIRYPGVMEAMRKTNINESNIRGAIKRKGTAGGFFWKYE